LRARPAGGKVSRTSKRTKLSPENRSERRSLNDNTKNDPLSRAKNRRSRRNRISAEMPLRDNNSTTIQENGRNKRKRSKINGSKSATPQIGDKPTSNREKSASSNNIGETLPRMIGRKAERGRINNDNSIRIAAAGQHNNGVHLRHVASMLPGRVIAHAAGSPSTAAGSNGGLQRLPSPR